MPLPAASVSEVARMPPLARVPQAPREPDGSCQPARIRPPGRKRPRPSGTRGRGDYPCFPSYRPRRRIARRARGGRSHEPGSGCTGESQDRGSRHRVRSRRTSARRVRKRCSRHQDSGYSGIAAAGFRTERVQNGNRRANTAGATTAADTAVEIIPSASGDVRGRRPGICPSARSRPGNRHGTREPDCRSGERRCGTRRHVLSGRTIAVAIAAPASRTAIGRSCRARRC